MSTLFFLFFLVQINGKDLVVNRSFDTLENCVEMAKTLTVSYYPKSSEWECTPKQGIRL